MHASKSSDESFKDSFPAISFGAGGVYSDIFSGRYFFETSDFCTSETFKSRGSSPDFMHSAAISPHTNPSVSTSADILVNWKARCDAPIPLPEKISPSMFFGTRLPYGILTLRPFVKCGRSSAHRDISDGENGAGRNRCRPARRYL